MQVYPNFFQLLPTNQLQFSRNLLQHSTIANHTFQALELHTWGSELHPATHNADPPKTLQTHNQFIATHCNSRLQTNTQKNDAEGYRSRGLEKPVLERQLLGVKAEWGYRSKCLGKPVLKRELSGNTAAGGYRSRHL